jgi:hypothetical protein
VGVAWLLLAATVTAPRPLESGIGLGFGSGTARPASVWMPVRVVPQGIPAIVFVSRNPIPGDPRAVPGLGPAHRTAATGGRLMLREPNGAVRELLPKGTLYDVSDPAVSFDARSIAFAGTPAPDSAWRLYVVGLDGHGLRSITRSDEGRPGRYDDFDPCWIGGRRLCFASTRFGLTAQYADVPVSNLYVVPVPRSGETPSRPRRITSESNGAEEPTLDPIRHEIVFARWWFNRYQASVDGITMTAATALPRDSVNLWEAVALDESGPHLACGDLRSRRALMAYQPAFLADGTPVGVYALNLGLWPRPGALGIQHFPSRVGWSERVAGASIPDSARGYGELGLAAPSACSPAGLPSGRVIFSYSPGGRGDFGLYYSDAEGHFAPQLLLDLPGTLELDAAPVMTRPEPNLHGVPDQALASRPATLANCATRPTFTYHSLGVFRGASPAKLAVAKVSGARLRFYAVPLVSAEAARDTAVLIGEAPIRSDGSIEERGLPADVPLFEQLVDSRGHVLVSAHGPAHVAGFNAGTPGGESRCLGCHLGHSAIRLPQPPIGTGR